MLRPGRGTAAALVLVALNLRLSVAAIPPVLSQIRASTGLGSVGGGVLTAIPVFCFGAVALLAPRLIRRFGLRRLIVLVLLAVIVGAAARLLGGVLALMLGTAVIGGAIAVGNVLVPSLIRRDFGDRRVSMTALYSVALSVGGGLAAGLTVPLEHLTGLGWRETVALWGVIAVLAVCAWLPHARGEPASGTRIGAGEPRSTGPGTPAGAGSRGSTGPGTPAGAGSRGSTGPGLPRGLWRDPLAWCVTLFMGLQSFGFYSTLSWTPTILESHGISAGTAGWLLSFSSIPGVLGALISPGLERRAARPVWLVIAVAGLCAGGLLGLTLSPAHGTYAWMALLGLGQGAALSLALGYIVARAGDADQATQLSTMAQSVGYMLAATGPFLLGALHGLTGGWTVPLGVLLALLVPFVAVGTVASRPGQVRPAR